MNNKTNQRIFYLIAFIVMMAIETVIAIFVHDDIIRPYIGDVLVVIILYCLVRVVKPVGCKLLPIYIFVFTLFIEVMQYFEILKVLGLNNNRLARVVIGSVFDVKDIMCYAVGCVILVMFEQFIYKRIKVK